MSSSPFSCVFDPDVSDNPRFQDLVAYWRQKGGVRTLPLRRDIDPLELQAHLGSLNIIECLPGLGDFRYRLIGTKIVEAYGRDSTGRTVRELYEAADPEYCAFLLEAYREVATRAVTARIHATLRPVHKHFRHADSLLLPLDGGDGSVRWLLNEVLFG
jgi:hypothetical protein